MGFRRRVGRVERVKFVERIRFIERLGLERLRGQWLRVQWLRVVEFVRVVIGVIGFVGWGLGRILIRIAHTIRG